MEREWYIVEVCGEGCYALCYDDQNGERVVVDWELEIREDWVALFELTDYNQVMEQLKQLIEQMQAEMREDLKRSGDLEQYGEEGIRIAVYEDLRDTLNHLFSDVAYK